MTLLNRPVYSVNDTEDIVRVVKTPHHLKKGRLSGNAFRPQKGKSVLSVIRKIMGLHFCWLKGEEICGEAFTGLAILNVGTVRSLGNVDVKDERDDFLGHAHINYQLISDVDNPNEDLIPLCKRMSQLARYLPNN